MMATTFLTTACGKKEEVYDNMVVFDDEKIDYDLVKFMASYEQAKVEKQQRETLGNEMWSEKNTQAGISLLEETKNEVMDNLRTMLVMEKHAADYKIELTDLEKEKIKIATNDFLEKNSKKALEQMGASEKVLTRYLELSNIFYKMYQKIGEEANQEIEESDYRQKKISYVYFSFFTDKTTANGQKIKLANKEIAQLSTYVNELQEEAKLDFDGTMKKEKLKIETKSYGNSVYEISHIDEAMLRSAERLVQEGDVSEAVEGADGYYLIRLDKLNDEEGSQAKKDKIINDRKENVFHQRLKEWVENSDFVINEQAWDTIKFEDFLTIIE